MADENRGAVRAWRRFVPVETRPGEAPRLLMYHMIFANGYRNDVVDHALNHVIDDPEQEYHDEDAVQIVANSNMAEYCFTELFEPEGGRFVANWVKPCTYICRSNAVGGERYMNPRESSAVELLEFVIPNAEGVLAPDRDRARGWVLVDYVPLAKADLARFAALLRQLAAWRDVVLAFGPQPRLSQKTMEQAVRGLIAAGAPSFYVHTRPNVGVAHARFRKHDDGREVVRYSIEVLGGAACVPGVTFAADVGPAPSGSGLLLGRGGISEAYARNAGLAIIDLRAMMEGPIVAAGVCVPAQGPRQMPAAAEAFEAEFSELLANTVDTSVEPQGEPSGWDAAVELLIARKCWLVLVVGLPGCGATSFCRLLRKAGYYLNTSLILHDDDGWRPRHRFYTGLAAERTAAYIASVGGVPCPDGTILRGPASVCDADGGTRELRLARGRREFLKRACRCISDVIASGADNVNSPWYKRPDGGPGAEGGHPRPDEPAELLAARDPRTARAEIYSPDPVSGQIEFRTAIVWLTTSPAQCAHNLGCAAAQGRCFDTSRPAARFDPPEDSEADLVIELDFELRAPGGATGLPAEMRDRRYWHRDAVAW